MAAGSRGVGELTLEGVRQEEPTAPHAPFFPAHTPPPAALAPGSFVCAFRQLHLLDWIGMGYKPSEASHQDIPWHD